MTRILTYAALLLAAGCGPGEPDTPTWAGDVKPIMVANCVRCHGYPATGGAPDSFRLDQFDDFVTADGERIVGAGAMASFVAVRVDEEQTADLGIELMPPGAAGQAFTDRQRSILIRWGGGLEMGELPDRGGPPSGNRAPTMELLRDLADSLEDGRLVIRYEIRDPDFELVSGELRAGGASFDEGARIGPVRSGRGEVIWDVGAEAEGSYTLRARLDDGGETHDVELETYEVVHPDGNTAPRLSVQRPRPHDIIADADLPYTIDIETGDPDAADVLTATIVARLGDEEVVVAEDAALILGTTSIDWDTSGLTESRDWQLEVTVSDGSATRTTTIESLVISHQETDLTYNDDTGVILQQRCGRCHSEVERVPGITFSVFEPAEVDALRGLIYRRAVVLANMPPPSAGAENVEPLSPEERATLAEWLLGGAPP